MSSNNTSICRNLSTEEAEHYVYTTADTILIVGVLPAISIIGILLNSAFLFTLYRVKDMRTTTNIYLANLAVADEMLLIIRLSTYLGTYLYLPIHYYFRITPFTSRFICGTPTLLAYLFSFASVFFISLVAFERYNAICRPATHRQTYSRARAMKLSLIAWAVSFGIVLCHNWSFDINVVCFVFPSSPDISVFIRTCTGGESEYMSITIIQLCQFLLACVGNCLLYIRIVQRLRNLRCNARKRSNHAAKMLSINACVFFICLLPREIINVTVGLFHVQTFGFVSDVLFWISMIAIGINSAVNPLIYNASNPDYRDAFRRAFTCFKGQSSLSTRRRTRRVRRVEEERTL